MKKEIEEIYTPYEKARILGARALQISANAPILLKIEKEKLEQLNYDPIKIAELEFQANVLPITVRRPLPKKIVKELIEAKEEEIIKEEKELPKEAPAVEERAKIEEEAEKEAEEAEIIEAEKEAEEKEEFGEEEVAKEFEEEGEGEEGE